MAVELAETSRVARGQGHLSADMGAQTVLMSIDHGKYIGLDAVGTAIWQRLAEPISVRDLCQQLMDAFTADAAELRRDVLAFLARLHHYGLVDIDPA